MERPKINFISKGLTVDYNKLFEQEVTYCPIDNEDFLYQFRFMNQKQAKSVPQILDMGKPDTAYAIAIYLCRYIPLFINRDDLQEFITTYETRIRKMFVESFSALVTTIRTWNNEEKCRYVYHFILLFRFISL